MKEHSKTAYDFSANAAKWLLDALLASMPSALIHCLVFLVISVVIIAVCQKFKAYTRLPRGWNALTKIHYFVLVAAFMALGFGLGLISSLQKSTNRVIDEKLHPALTEMVPPVTESILESLPAELAEKPMTGEEIYDYLMGQMGLQQDAAEGGNGGGLVGEIGHEVEIQVRAFVIKKLIDQAIAKVAENADVSPENAKFELEVFKSIDFGKKADEIANKATNTARKQVGGFAWSLRIQLIIYWAIVMGLLAIDPLIYYLVWLPRQRKKAAEEAVQELA